MSETPTRKLPKAQRREQLLDIAQTIVREEGTDALTLGYVAERAGVSKPIAYEHFKTRSGLLIALYEQIDAQQVQALLEALKRTRKRLEDVARVMSAAYMHCYTSAGPEWHAITAAMKGDEEMEAFHRELLDSYVAIYRETLAPYSNLERDALHLRCVGIIGAAEAISRDMLRGLVDEATAAETLASLIVSWLSRKA
ncbi:TetR/AcrR family transcriptional regulator [Corallococcus praedator]|uniref:TetR/AcrR family transcriptional regulator n=1 Tax=Corallococcus praedator TaxID=2316724 RepID=A0ABX9QR40_9BACT|nr:MULTISPECIES: TetR/AcrR family transcriptional regulator [Corallococcus]RKH33406.1 TetR/AcrR family transcriptional regulator [Corallococcus sp. CA031C]RKI14530.1 TetR/AcrR family transcriptional regulator [Corallococcus praedator]